MSDICKIIQIAVSSDSEDTYGKLYALDDQGTIYERSEKGHSRWKMVDCPIDSTWRDED
jgi:hypothetical protein